MGRQRSGLRAGSVAVRLVVVAVACAQVAEQAQAQPRDRGMAPSLAAFVPGSTKVFITSWRLGDLDRTLQQTQAWRLIELLGGRTEPAKFDLARRLQGFFDPQGRLDPKDFLRSEVGVAADSLARLGDGAWLVRVADDEMLRRWFPQQGFRSEGRSAARVFRTDEGLTVCVRDRVVALARPGADWVQLGDILRTMTAQDTSTLEQSAGFRELIAYLPARPLVTLYLDQSASEAPEASAVWTDRLVVGIYSVDGRVDVAFRGLLAQPASRRPLSRAAVERMLILPRSTLGAYLVSVDWEELMRSEASSSNALHRLLHLLASIHRGETQEGDPAPRLGHHVLAVWDQDLAVDGTTPQAALLVETEDSRMFNASAERVFRALVRMISTLELRDVTAELEPIQESHLGVTITTVPLARYAESSRFAWVKVLANLEPSWAAGGKWFIVALTREHLKHLLDAQIGFTGVLGDLRDARGLRDQPERHSAIALLQGGAASDTLRRWVMAAQAGHPSLLAGGLLSRAPVDALDPHRLGIEMAEQAEPGMVTVLHVETLTPAEGRFQPGDRIIGVDGRLLELAVPEDDLRQWWEAAEPGSTHKVRVLRGSAVTDLEIVRRHDEVSLSSLFAKPLDALKELSALCEAIPFASLQVHAADPNHVSALISLRMTGDQP